VRRLLLLVALALAGCGGSSGSGTERVDLMLDFFPNADHAGIYSAQHSGSFRNKDLDVRIHAPSDPSVPLKLLDAGRTDLAISYEPEVLRARDKGLHVKAVAALVRVPLTSVVSLPGAGIRAPSDLNGKEVGTAGIDYQTAYLKAIAPGAKPRNVGFDLVPALVSGKVDAVLGAYWNYEAIQLRQKGRDPRVIRMENAGVPTYDELVVAARDDADPEMVRRFLAGLEDGTRALARDQAAGVDALVAANKDLDPKLQRASVKATLPYFLPPPGKPFGYMDPAAWRRFTAFMHANGLLKLSSPSGAMTNDLLP
jgi:putative hydroxymethylpyrimidine transport system substrate-binding protein